MKVAFHFNAFHPSLCPNYGDNTEKILFDILLNYRNLNLSSKILTGDLLLHNLAYEVKTTVEGTEARTSNQERYFQIINLWLQPKNTVWLSIITERLTQALKDVIFIICVETIEPQLTKYLDDQLRERSEGYLGAIEVDEAS